MNCQTCKEPLERWPSYCWHCMDHVSAEYEASLKLIRSRWAEWREAVTACERDGRPHKLVIAEMRLEALRQAIDGAVD